MLLDDDEAAVAAEDAAAAAAAAAAALFLDFVDIVCVAEESVYYTGRVEPLSWTRAAGTTSEKRTRALSTWIYRDRIALAQHLAAKCALLVTAKRTAQPNGQSTRRRHITSRVSRRH